MRFRLTLEYDGANYSGWQLQQGQDSIQARIEAALAQLFNQPIRIHAAGRTDAGVHARGQVAAFTAPRAIDPIELRRALNALLPADIAVHETSVAADDFDPRRSAKSRIYEYRILNRQQRSAFAFRYAWLVREPLDLESMREAAAHFVGEHDFAAFRTLGSDEKTTIRRVAISEWRRETDDILVYCVEATAFLRHMVRTMVASMVEVGRGRLQASGVTALIESRDRAQAPAMAPACGLCLMAVRY